jgi:predicted RNase H-like nuclease (RuvC/YqgF family)
MTETMEVDKKALIHLIKQINSNVDKLIFELNVKDKQIEELKIQNQELKSNSSTILNQIKEYIKELEEIRNHYVDSNNNSK